MKPLTLNYKNGLHATRNALNKRDQNAWAYIYIYICTVQLSLMVLLSVLAVTLGVGHVVRAGVDTIGYSTAHMFAHL